ncbi:MAG TPA: peptidoglycan-binding domain-containing protein [Woeseiaceae bacterium]|nr:peptidoglycan-binding domain-containing protein [Woeseiaceae bacterium]
MLNFFRTVTCLALALLPTSLLADEPPNGPAVTEILEEQGWEPMSDGAITTVRGMLRAQWLVEEWRLRRSNVVVLKTVENMTTLPGGQGVPIFQEFMMVQTERGPRLYGRIIPPEEVQRREMEASDIPREQMAQAMHAYAGGAMMLGEALRQEVAGSPMSGLMNERLGFQYGMSSPVIGDHHAFNAQDCLLILGFQIEGEEFASASGPQGEFDIKPWTSINPATFMMGPACMALFAAEVLLSVDEIDEDTAKQMIDAIDAAIDEYQLAGMETLDGRPTARIRLDDVNMIQSIAGLPLERLLQHDYAAKSVGKPNDYGDRMPAVYHYDDDTPFVVAKSSGNADGTFAINTIELWIDTEYFVRRKMRMEGVMTDEGQSRDVFFEQAFQDYRNVPDSYLYMPYRKVMRAGGVLTEAQRRELAEAQEQLEEFEQQMAAMPASQRQMMERMMGGQIEQMRNLVNNGAVEIVMETSSIEINPSFRNPMLVEFASKELGGSGDTGGNLVQQIQIDLTTLGYEPGNVAGDLDTMTQVAISQFQAEQNLAVTGQPSNELARALRVAISQQ